MLLRFVEQGIVERCEPSPGNAFYSNVFPTLKKDGITARVILNLKELNPYVTHTHFKMDSFKDVVRLVQPQCFFMTIDFQDAYYSVYVRPEERCWLRFFWKGQCFHFTCLPQGLTSAPRIFTKLLKPVFSHLRSLGIMVICYIDDCIFFAASEEELISNVSYALYLFDSVGLTINVKKISFGAYSGGAILGDYSKLMPHDCYSASQENN